jgi:hypothetical protein
MVKVTKQENADEKVLKIPPLDLQTAKITIVGISPLLVNRFDEKARAQIDDKVRGRGRQKKEFVDPNEKFERALYKMPGTKKYGVPASALKNCAVSACRFVDGIPMTVARGAFHVIGGPGNLVELLCSEPVLDERMGRNPNSPSKSAVTIIRPRFDEWSVTFPVRYNARVISPEQLLNLYENAGFSVGLHEYRPEKNGSFGMFSVKRA